MKVVATLACRVQSKRLYAKPLQFLDIEREISIVEYIISFLKTCPLIDAIVLAISEGVENKPFEHIAQKMRIPFINGSQKDVLQRLITAADKEQGDIVYRVTTECPFIYMDNFLDVLKAHIANKAALTVIEGLPEGAYYELIDLNALKYSHKHGEDRHRSEFCNLFLFEHPEQFFLQRLTVPDVALKRPELRLTVDYPEDLIVVREIYKALKKEGSFIPLDKIIRFMDANPGIKNMNGWIDAGVGRIWN